MVFPLSSRSKFKSLLSSLPSCLESSEKRECLSLASALDAIVSLSKVAGLSPGSLPELKLCAAHFPEQLSAGDKRAHRAFVEFYLLQNRANAAPICTLKEHFSQLSTADLPPFNLLIESLIQCLEVTGMFSFDEEVQEWKRILRSYYPDEMADPEETSWRYLLGLLRSNLAQSQSSKEQLQFRLDLLSSRKAQVQRLNFVLNQPLKKRRQLLLEELAPTFPEQRAAHLQNICNVLLRENYLLMRIEELLEFVHEELNLSPNCQVAKRGLANLLRQLESDSQWVPSTFCELMLILRVESKIEKVCPNQRNLHKLRQSKNFTQSVCAHSAIAQLDAVGEFAIKVGQQFSRSITEDTIQSIISKQLKDIKCLKVKIYCENFLAHFCDLHVKLHSNFRTGPSQQDEPISPLFLATWTYLLSTFCPKTQVSDIWETIDFLARTALVYRDAQSKQNQLYKLAFEELHKLVQSQHLSAKRTWLLFEKIAPEFSHYRGTLPNELKRSVGSKQNTSPPLSDVPEVSCSTPRADETSAKAVLQSTDQPPIATRPLQIKCATPFPFDYATRVTRWVNARVRLDPQLFPDYAHAHTKYQQRMIVLHAFASSADYFWRAGVQFSSAGSRGDKDVKRFVLPAELEIDQVKERGCVVWAVNEHDICYHRFFHIKPMDELCEKIICRTFTDADFPELVPAQRFFPGIGAKQFIDAHLLDSSAAITFDELLGIVTLEDSKSSNRLRLYLVHL